MQENFSDVPLLILSAGKSSRMGSPKGLLSFHNKPLLINHLENYQSIGGKHVIIVLGFQADLYFKEIPWLNKAKNQWFLHNGMNIWIQVNKHPEKGQYSSLVEAKDAINTVSPKCFYVTPVDILSPDRAVWERLLTAMNEDIKVCVPTYNYKGGHPVLLSIEFFKTLVKIPLDSKDARLDKQIHHLPGKTVRKTRVSDKRVALNLNSKTDLSAIKHVEK